MNFRPLYDMVLVKPDPLPEKIGSIFLPEGALADVDEPGDSRDSFIGTVVATGPGDGYVTLKCTACGERRLALLKRARFQSGIPTGTCVCGVSASEIVKRGHWPMQLQVGDRVVGPRRATMPGGEYSITIEGEKYIMFHEEQFAYGVVVE